MPGDINDVDDWPARQAYKSGADPVAYAEERVAMLAEVHVGIAIARTDNPAAFPIYSRDVSFGALSRRILGHLLSIGWTPPDINPPAAFIEGVPAGLDDLDGPS